MRRKTMSIIGRIIGLLLVVALAFGITWCATHWSKVQAESQKVWDKLFGKKDQQEQVQPTPNEEQINLDGLYYLVVDGDTTFVQIKDSKYGTIHGYIQDSKIYLASDWESEIELEPFHITEDEKYLHVFWIDQENGQEDKIAIYDKATKKLYYDFSNGKQFPGETYEDQLLFEMIKFENFELHEHSFDEIVYSCPPSCNAAGREIRKCLCKKTEMIETSPALGHDYVNGKCTRCGESDPNYVEACEHDWVEDLSYVPTAPSCGEYWDTQYKCSKCNETKLEKNGPLPHDWVDGVCSRCGTQCQHVHENGHICPICGCEVEKKLTWRVGKPATCTENGVEYGDCICGYNSEMREIPALGHDYVDGTCSRCGETDPNHIEVCEHNFEKITCSTTCVSDGTEVEECSICGFTRYNSIPAYGHNYVNGVCSRCGETDPNHVVAPVSLDGMYYFITNDGVVLVNQIEGDKYVQFTAYFRNGDQSVIYLPQDYEGYIENGYTLSITETDTNIVASIVEIPSLGEYFNYDKTTQTLYFGGTPITKITNFEILPYEEPTFSIVDNKLLLTDMTQYEGTYSIYYKLLNASEGEDTSEYAYVAGNVTEFDLNLLINRDYMPMLVGRDYRIRVAFQTDGFDLYGGVALYTASVDADVLTWTLNDSNITMPASEFRVTINFNVSTDNVINTTSFSGIAISPTSVAYMWEPDEIFDYAEFDGDNLVWMEKNGLDTSAYRTITFETAPTGELLAWLQANATPQV